MKTIADGKINVIKKLKFMMETLVNIGGKGFF